MVMGLFFVQDRDCSGKVKPDELVARTVLYKYEVQYELNFRRIMELA